MFYFWNMFKRTFVDLFSKSSCKNFFKGAFILVPAWLHETKGSTNNYQRHAISKNGKNLRYLYPCNTMHLHYAACNMPLQQANLQHYKPVLWHWQASFTFRKPWQVFLQVLMERIFVKPVFRANWRNLGHFLTFRSQSEHFLETGDENTSFCSQALQPCV